MAEAVIRRKRKEWLALNPILRNGQTGQEINSGRIKIGDGRKRWTQLTWVNVMPATTASQTPIPAPTTVTIVEQIISPQSEPTMLEHVEADAPHSAYDDIPSLVLLYQNAKV